MNAAAAASTTATTVTSLEATYNYAYNVAVSEGKWAEHFGSLDVNLPLFCSGNYESWMIDGYDGNDGEGFSDPVPGSDLARVLDSGIFKAGTFNFDFSDASGNLLQGIDEEGRPYGPAISFLGDVISFMNNVTESELVVEWTVFETSQDAFESLYNLTVDAVTPIYGNNGLFQIGSSSGDSGELLSSIVARELVFSFAHCPTLSLSEIIQTPFSSGIESFRQLVEASNSGLVTAMCLPGDNTTQTVTLCQSLMDTYTLDETKVTCVGVGETTSPFEQLNAGDCQAVWGGGPSEDNQLYNQFPPPVESIGGSFFRISDFFGLLDLPEDSTIEFFPHTSLELAMISAINALDGDKTWVDYFGDSIDLVQASSCTGQGEGAWPWPDVDDGTDLAVVISRGTFRCGYTPFVAATSDGITLINITSDDGNLGRLPSYYEEIIAAMASHYDTPIDLEWVLLETSDGAFSALESNEIDAACAYWYPDGTVPGSSGERISRAAAFSQMPCTSFLQSDYIHVETSVLNSGTSWNEFIDDINNLPAVILPATICVPDEPSSGLLPGCSELFAQYTGGNAVCEPIPEADGPDYNAVAFQKLLDGECWAVFSGIPPEDATGISSIRQPGLLPPVSFFRNSDYVDNNTPPVESTDVPSEAPSQSPSGSTGIQTPLSVVGTTVMMLITSVVIH